MFDLVHTFNSNWQCSQPVCDYQNGYFSVSVIKYSN